MCVGVGSGFPTRVSMYLRERYHRGNEAIPSIFCIEYISEKAFKNKLDGVMKFCEVRGVVELDNGVIAVPWKGEHKDAVEGTWVISRAAKLRVGRKGVSLVKSNAEKFNSLTVEIEYKAEDFSIEAVDDVFRSWSQKIQLDAINKTLKFVEAKEYAQSTYGLMIAIVEDIKNVRGLDILSDASRDSSSFLNEVLNLQIFRTGRKIAGYVKAVEEIKNGRDLSLLDEFEAAKIIGLGTITGKAQQRANSLKNMTPNKL